MAEAVVVFLIKKIGEAVVTEGFTQAKSLSKRVRKVHRQMRDIKGTLELMQAFLKYADKRINDDGRLATWVKLVRELAFDIEDVIDEYVYIMGSRTEGGFIAYVYNKCKIMNSIKALKDISNQLQDFRNTLQSLSADKITFDVKISADDASTSNSIAVTESLRLAESAHTKADEDIIGVDKHKQTLVDWLIDDQSSERKVISVYGMGGVGKTTLATSVSRSSLLDDHFGCKAWVSVSKNYTINDLLKKIIREFYRGTTISAPSDLESKDYRSLVEELRHLLKDKSYLIILDDIWETKVWDELCGAIFENHLKSRVIITTRSREVACITDESRILKLEPLDEPVAIDLFCHYAFHKQKDRDCPQHLKQWVNKIVNRCGRLPLALVWLGNFLARKEQTEFEWKRVHDILASSGEKDEVPQLKRIEIILGLSIDDLPYYLRSCFLYCSIFPEDYEIRKKTLLRLWVSEGFIGERVGSTKMVIAEDYLNQLVGRCMFEVAERNLFGQAKKLRIHDLVLDMIVNRQRVESFSEHWDGNFQKGPVKEKILCLSITKLDSRENKSYQISTLRSLHCFAEASQLPVRNFKLLRVLNLQYSGVSRLPKEVGMLFNLHYLGIRGTLVKQLPNDICMLRNLQTLDALSIKVKIPQGISKLNKLEHLLMGNYLKSCNIEKIRDLKNLQTLKTITATDELVQDLGSLTELRTLKIVWVSSSEQSKELATHIAKMEKLSNLHIIMKYPEQGGRPRMQLDCGLTSSSSLRKIFLDGPLDNSSLPKYLLSLANLESLTLEGSDLGQDPLPTLALSLPNLFSLTLKNCCSKEVVKLCFPPRSLPKLKALFISFMDSKEVEIHKETLARLEKVSFGPSILLKTISKH